MCQDVCRRAWGRICHANGWGAQGLDVFPEEPWPELAALASRPNVLLTPHAAGYYEGLGMALAEELSRTVEAFVRGGSIPHPVEPAPS